MQEYPKKVIGYIRISTLEQEDTYSMAWQLDKIKSYCHLRGFELLKVTEEIHSSREGKLKILDKTVDEILHNPDINGLVVAATSRLGRDDIKPRVVARKLLKGNKDLYACDLGLSDLRTTMGYSMFSFAVMMANIENLTKSAQTKEKLSFIRKTENKATFKPWVGYMIKDGKFVPEPYNSVSVKQIFFFASQGIPIKEICTQIKIKQLDGSFKNPTSDLCREILKRKLYYIGKYLNVDTEISFEPIIPEKLWKDANSKLKRKHQDSRYLQQHTRIPGEY